MALSVYCVCNCMSDCCLFKNLISKSHLDCKSHSVLRMYIFM